MATTRKRPVLLEYRSSTVFIVSTVCLAIFTDVFLYGLVVPVIPYSIEEQAGVPKDQVQQWTSILLACYGASLFLASPVVGAVADRTSSRRLPLLLGLLALAAATLLLCLARTLALFVVGRLLQGLSAGMVWAVGLALLADTMGANMGYAVGYVSTAMGLGYFVAPIAGGALYAAAGYYSVFYLAFVLIACDIFMRLALVEKKVALQWLELEELSSVATPDEATPAEPKPAEEKQQASETITVPSTLTSSWTQHPYMRLFRSRRILTAFVGCFLISALMVALDAIVPIFVKNTFHWDSTAAGLVFMAVTVPGFSGPLIGLLSDRCGARIPAAAGFAMCCPLLVCLRFVTDNSITHKILLVVLFALLGTAMAFVQTPLMAEISYAVEAKQKKHPGIWGDVGIYGVAFGLFVQAFALGGTIGSLVAGFIVAGPGGWGTVTWSLAVCCAPGAVVVAIWTGGPPDKAGAVAGSGQVA